MFILNGHTNEIQLQTHILDFKCLSARGRMKNKKKVTHSSLRFNCAYPLLRTAVAYLTCVCVCTGAQSSRVALKGINKHHDDRVRIAAHKWPELGFCAPFSVVIAFACVRIARIVSSEMMRVF